MDAMMLGMMFGYLVVLNILAVLIWGLLKLAAFIGRNV